LYASVVIRPSLAFHAGEASLAEIAPFLAADLAVGHSRRPWNEIGMPWLRGAYAMEAQAIEQGAI
jgi:hypothetical protein